MKIGRAMQNGIEDKKVKSVGGYRLHCAIGFHRISGRHRAYVAALVCCPLARGVLNHETYMKNLDGAK